MSVQSILIRAKEASPSLAAASTDAKNVALARIAQLLLDNSNAIVRANAIDLKRGEENGLSQGR
jgi:glutamate-5-semialdehyde dehydrogenase